MSVATANANVETDGAPISDDACKQLWCAVLQQAVEDAKAPKPILVVKDWQAIADTRNRTKTKTMWTAESVRQQAETAHRSAVNKWQADRDYIGGRSFRQVCWLCGLDPEAVEWRVRQQMAKS